MMQAEIDVFHKKIKARALLIAVRWAGSADALARMVGLNRDAGSKWLQRGHIPPQVAISLTRISGFPLGFGEMCPGLDLRTASARKRCPHCMKDIGPRDLRSGCSPLLKRRSEAAARKLAAQTPGAIQKARIAKRKPRAPKS